jgi:hypothetical protein
MADEIMTWLPYQDFLTTFQTLSDYHVGRQMHEAGIVLDYLVGIGHEKLCDRFRTTRMWKGYPSALAFYHSMAIREHVMRGGRPLRTAAYDFYHGFQIETLHYAHRKLVPVQEIEYPPWLGDERLHASHRGALFRQYPEHYFHRTDWIEYKDLPLFWPESAGEEPAMISRGFAPSNDELKQINHGSEA